MSYPASLMDVNEAHTTLQCTKQTQQPYVIISAVQSRYCQLLVLRRYGNFLTEEECDHLIKISKPNMKDATTVNKTTGKETPNR